MTLTLPRTGHSLLFLALFATPLAAQSLPGTDPWPDRVDTPSAAAAMVEGLHRFADRELAASISQRSQHWKIDNTSAAAWTRSIEPNRARFRALLGLGDPRAEELKMELVATTETPALIAESSQFRVLAVRWPVFNDVHAEGLLLEPKGKVKGNVVALPDAAQTPEQLAGLVDDFPPAQQVARLMAEEGYRVVVPTILSRDCAFSGNPAVRMTNLTHREWIWRQAYEVGRHPLGYEVETVSAAIDWFLDKKESLPTGVAGYGEGGLVAFYAAAADSRIDAAWVAAAFGHTRDVWNQPIERDVFGLLSEFGDAEIANLIVPRALILESCVSPAWDGPLPPVGGRSDAASGVLKPQFSPQALAEWKRRQEDPSASFPGDAGQVILLAEGDQQATLSWNDREVARRYFQSALQGIFQRVMSYGQAPPAHWTTRAPLPSPDARMARLVAGWTRHTQRLLETSELRRYDLWKDADSSSPEAWSESVKPLREKLWTEVIGKFPPASEPLKPRSAQVLDEPKFTGHAVELPVYPDVVASGILLLPKDLKPGEKRPVVVCQHGLEGTPQEVVDPAVESPYHSYGARLADLGYIVYAPQNPYIGHDRFRQLQRKLHPLGKSLFAVIVRQHERTLEWLKTLPGVDPDRIAFYGLSYGGKTAMRVPALLPDYCLSICSADFNEWVTKCTNLDRALGYMYTIEYDMYEWDLANGFNYAEIAALIAPRPFQIERGHFDGVAPDEWIGYEYAKVKRTYDLLGLPDHCDITYFVGPHEIKGEATFDFLARHLDWPRTPSLEPSP